MEENGLEREVTEEPIKTPEESEISKNNEEAFNKLRDLFAINGIIYGDRVCSSIANPRKYSP